MKKLLMLIFMSTLMGHLSAARGDFSLTTLSCQTSNANCDFYQCLEDRVSCGAKGYPIHFGQRLCNKYLDSAPTASAGLQAWYPKVRACLQEVLLTLDNVKDCKDLLKQAFLAHVGCYVQTGFCDLSWPDKITVATTAGTAMLGLNAMESALAVQNICNQLGTRW